MLLGDDKREELFKYVDTAFMVTPGLRLFNETLNYMEDENVRRHIELTYIQMFQNLEHPDIAKRNARYRYLDVKICDFEDYSLNDQMKKLYEFNQKR